MKDPTVHWCSNCDKRMVRVKGLCNRCYSYQRLYKRPRPARLWDTERVIEVCYCGDFAVVSGECEERPACLTARTSLMLCAQGK